MLATLLISITTATAPVPQVTAINYADASPVTMPWADTTVERRRGETCWRTNRSTKQRFRIC